MTPAIGQRESARHSPRAYASSIISLGRPLPRHPRAAAFPHHQLSRRRLPIGLQGPSDTGSVYYVTVGLIGGDLVARSLPGSGRRSDSRCGGWPVDLDLDLSLLRLPTRGFGHQTLRHRHLYGFHASGSPQCAAYLGGAGGSRTALGLSPIPSGRGRDVSNRRLHIGVGPDRRPGDASSQSVTLRCSRCWHWSWSRPSERP